MPTGDLAGDPLRVATFISDAKKADLVGFLAQCGELHAGTLPALRTAAGFYGMAQPLRAAAALAALKRGADPPLGVVRSHDQREQLGDLRAGPGSSVSSSAKSSSSGSSPSSSAVGDGAGDHLAERVPLC